MSRKRNSIFQGSPISDVDPDQLTWKRVIDNAIGDQALIGDIITGDNSPPANTSVDHRGAGRGCLLGLPLASMFWPSRAYALEGPSLASTGAVSTTETYVAVFPFYLPRGETRIDIKVGSDSIVPILVEVRSTLGTLQAKIALDRTADDMHEGSIGGLTAATRYVLLLRRTHMSADGVGTEAGVQLWSIWVGFDRYASQDVIGEHANFGAGAFDVPTTAVSDAGGNAAVMSLTSFDTALIADAMAISSYHLSRLNQNQNALEEHITGAPCSGNTSYTLADSDGTAADPTTTAFDDHSGASVSGNQPLVDIPIWAQAFGGINTDGTAAAFFGAWEPMTMVGAGASPSEVFLQVDAFIPDGPNGSGTSKLEAIIVCAGSTVDGAPGSPDVDLVAEGMGGLVQCFDSGGSSKTAKTGSFVAMTNLGAKFFFVTLSAIEFYPDQRNVVKFGITDGPADGESARILGACLHMKAS